METQKIRLIGRATLDEIRKYGVLPEIMPENPSGEKACNSEVQFTTNDDFEGEIMSKRKDEDMMFIKRNLEFDPLPAPFRAGDTSWDFLRYVLGDIDLSEIILEYYINGGVDAQIFKDKMLGDKFVLAQVKKFDNIYSDKAYLCDGSPFRKARRWLIAMINSANLSVDWLHVFGMWSDDLILLDAIAELGKILPEADDTHGLVHAKQVLRLAELELCEWDLPRDVMLAVKLAALLHDADDRKLFPQNTDENALAIMKQTLTNDPQYGSLKSQVLDMINLVSFSENANDEDDPPFMLIPRYADRLEAIGEIGIYRTYKFGRHRNRSVFNENTPIVRTEEELCAVLTAERLNDYMLKKSSVTTMDHMYDKLLQIARPNDMKYLGQLHDERMAITRQFVLDYWNNPDYKNLQKIIPKYEYCTYANFI